MSTSQSLREHDMDCGMESIGHGARLSWALNKL